MLHIYMLSTIHKNDNHDDNIEDMVTRFGPLPLHTLLHNSACLPERFYKDQKEFLEILLTNLLRFWRVERLRMTATGRYCLQHFLKVQYIIIQAIFGRKSMKTNLQLPMKKIRV